MCVSVYVCILRYQVDATGERSNADFRVGERVEDAKIANVERGGIPATNFLLLELQRAISKKSRAQSREAAILT